MDTTKKLADALREIGEWEHRGDSVAEAYDEKHGFGAFMTLIEDAALSTPAATIQPSLKVAAADAVSEVQRTAPARIYLQVSDDPASTDTPFPKDPHGDEVTWSEDQALDVTVEYVRADLARCAAPEPVALTEMQIERAWRLGYQSSCGHTDGPDNEDANRDWNFDRSEVVKDVSARAASPSAPACANCSKPASGPQYCSTFCFDQARATGRHALHERELHAAQDKQHVIAAFLERTGQYVTNDATRDAAIADAVKSALAQAVPEGWKLVPIEPTEAMLSAGYDAVSNDGDTYLRPAWRYMLAAAPTPSKGEA